jgi:hypothetical protein
MSASGGGAVLAILRQHRLSKSGDRTANPRRPGYLEPDRGGDRRVVGGGVVDLAENRVGG